MPRERSLVAYPNDHYIALCRHVTQTGKPLLLVMTPSQAATMRGELYAWRRVAEKSPIEAGQRGIDLTMIRKVSLRITSQGLEAIPDSMVPGPAAIEKALGAIERALSPADKALANLKSQLGADEDGVAKPLPYDLGDKG